MFESVAVVGATGAVGRLIRRLLEDYYDPMYDYQLSRRAGERLFSGDRDAVVEWATARSL